MEAACLMRRAYSDEEFEAMGARWLNAAHPSIESAYGSGELDIISGTQGGRWLSGHVRGLDYRHPRDEAFLFDDARAVMRGMRGSPRIARRPRPPSSLPPEPEDFGDEAQMGEYLASLRKFFRNGKI